MNYLLTLVCSTFSHNSNFFLFATLEQARPIAQGRGMPAPAPAPAPVLTGVPVSGMAYLDRPKPAGYFIFPDLSVRHEGKYRLRFSLYEECKDPDEMSQPAHDGEPREFAAHRVEVKSRPFTVYSAKKFPGLAESTALSRIVAEQGCRVRIRRDVRMRRRSDRSGREGDSEIDETAQLRAQRRAVSPNGYDHDMRNHAHNPPQTPLSIPQPSSHGHHIAAGPVDRKRSDSNASIVSMAEAPVPPRFDDRYAPRQEHNPYGVSPPGPPSNNSHQHLSFGSNTNNVHHHPVLPPNIHPPQLYNPHAMQPRYQANQPVTQHHQQSPPAPRPQPVQNGQYGVAPPPYHRESNGHIQHAPVRRESTSQEYQSSTTHVHRESDAYRQHHAPAYRPSTPSPPSQGAQYQVDTYNPAPTYQSSQPPPYHSSASAQPTPTSLPSLKLPPLAIEPKVWEGRTITSPPVSAPTAAPPLPSPKPYPPPPPPTSQPSQTHYASQYSYPPQPYIPVQPTPATRPQPADQTPRGTKREWGRVFNDTHVAEPLHNGKRPDTISEHCGYGEDAADDEDDFDLGKMKMTYRRAGGEQIVRRLPLEE